jgi:hypothetical protein
MTQTALEWLIEQLTRLFNQLEIGEIQIDEYKYYLNLILEQAKEMEKQQIIDAWSNGYDEEDRATSNPFNYYNETFKNKL